MSPSEIERLAGTVDRVAREQKCYRTETIKDLRAAANALRDFARKEAAELARAQALSDAPL